MWKLLILSICLMFHFSFTCKNWDFYNYPGFAGNDCQYAADYNRSSCFGEHITGGAMVYLELGFPASAKQLPRPFTAGPYQLHDLMTKVNIDSSDYENPLVLVGYNAKYGRVGSVRRGYRICIDYVKIGNKELCGDVQHIMSDASRGPFSPLDNLTVFNSNRTNYGKTPIPFVHILFPAKADSNGERPDPSM